MAELLRVEALERRLRRGASSSQTLDLALDDGNSLALLGRNGVGKTTLINSLIGVTTRAAGRIFARRRRSHRACRRTARARRASAGCRRSATSSAR